MISQLRAMEENIMEVFHYNLTKKFNDLSLQLESPIVFLKENQSKPKKTAELHKTT
jgi:hypothetical protein